MAEKNKQDELLDELLKGCTSPDQLYGDGGPLRALQKRFFERTLDAELETHLGYSKHKKKAAKGGNSRNGRMPKTVQTDSGQFEISTPRDRDGSFEPQIIAKRQKRLPGFDDKIIALYARGMSVRDIQANLNELYGANVSEGLISNITDSILEDVRLWQSRPLDAVYPIVYFDGISVKSREDGRVRNKCVYLALAVTMEGQKELLGMWIANNEGAKFWLSIITELKNRGVEDIFISCVDGLKGFPEAIESVFPQTQVQLCVIHMIRNSVRYVSWKDRKALCADLKKIYGASTLPEAEGALNQLAENWDERYPTVSMIWRNHWDNITPFFDYPEDIRKVIYTTNAIESLNRSLRKILKTKGSFPNDESIFKLMFLALQKISTKWTMPIRNWNGALNQFAIRFEGRFKL